MAEWSGWLGPLVGALGGSAVLTKLIEWWRGRHLDDVEVAAKRAEIEAGLDARWAALLDRVNSEAEQLRERVAELDSQVAELREKIRHLEDARRDDAAEISRLHAVLAQHDIDPGGKKL